MSQPLIDVISVQPTADYRLYLTFENGISGELDISQLINFEGVFSPLKNRDYFVTVKVNTETGTICWSNGADIAPELLYTNINH
jgi:hypothetical protein